MLTINPSDLSVPHLHNYLQSAVAPRPIALASTLDEAGKPNLSPFSFFNLFSSNPPVLIFSPSRRVRDNTTKHTLENVKQTGQVVINVVTYDIVQQVSLASTEYAKGVNEFVKAGLTMLPSELVKPYRVAESPVQFECKVTQIVPLGQNGGAGNLVICEILRMHISESILDENGHIDQQKIDLVSRLGGNWYSRANAGLFEVPKPLATQGIGIDNIPDDIRASAIFSGNDLGMLGNVEALPTPEEIDTFVRQEFAVKSVLSAADPQMQHELAREYIRRSDVVSAWKVLLAKPV
jgi:flavin reductase (DIM6/NTAB) family NADH-FMN oxidoreductase RutF